MTAVAALESGQAPARSGPSAITVAAYVAGGALLTASFALFAGFYSLRSTSAVWPPKEVEFDEYFSVMLTATLLLSGAVVAWASGAARSGNRRQSLGALVLALGLGGAFLNLAWYTGIHASFGPSSHAFGAIVITSLALGSAAVVSGLGFLTFALLRVQLRPDRSDVIVAAARYWFLVIAAWMATPVALYGLMSPK
jgi:heme/copper-type cytochrome/quinol oxidase subunit 3